MITGHVTDDGVPAIVLEVGGQQWRAIIDTGFNGDVELPESLQSQLDNEYVGRVSSLLAAGQQIEEDVYLVAFPFDGRILNVQATFVAADEILMGTHMLQRYRLIIDFPAKTLSLEVTWLPPAERPIAPMSSLRGLTRPRRRLCLLEGGPCDSELANRASYCARFQIASTPIRHNGRTIRCRVVPLAV